MRRLALMLPLLGLGLLTATQGNATRTDETWSYLDCAAVERFRATYLGGSTMSFNYSSVGGTGELTLRLYKHIPFWMDTYLGEKKVLAHTYYRVEPPIYIPQSRSWSGIESGKTYYLTLNCNGNATTTRDAKLWN